MRCKPKRAAAGMAQGGTALATGTSVAKLISYDPVVNRETLAQFICGTDLLIGFGERLTFKSI